MEQPDLANIAVADIPETDGNHPVSGTLKYTSLPKVGLKVIPDKRKWDERKGSLQISTVVALRR